MAETSLLVQVCERMGGATEVEGRRALRATLATVGEHLPPDEAQRLARALPAELGAWTAARPHCPVPTAAAFFERVAAREDVTPGFGREHAEAVCDALWNTLPADVRERVFVHLPPGVAPPMLQDRFAPSLIARHAETLASGAPGSRRPLCEAAPPDRVQADSVVASDDPHHARKLSTGAASPDRDDRTLARGRPGGANPLSESKPR
jgi:uncharacterized protein (DUF2267 family)